MVILNRTRINQDGLDSMLGTGHNPTHTSHKSLQPIKDTGGNTVTVYEYSLYNE